MKGEAFRFPIIVLLVSVLPTTHYFMTLQLSDLMRKVLQIFRNIEIRNTYSWQH